jgi:hypothetical protein
MEGAARRLAAGRFGAVQIVSFALDARAGSCAGLGEAGSCARFWGCGCARLEPGLPRKGGDFLRGWAWRAGVWRSYGGGRCHGHDGSPGRMVVKWTGRWDRHAPAWQGVGLMEGAARRLAAGRFGAVQIVSFALDAQAGSCAGLGEAGRCARLWGVGCARLEPGAPRKGGDFLRGWAWRAGVWCS